MKKKTNNLNSVLENIVNQYFGDFSLQENKKEEIKETPIVEKTEEKKEAIDPNTFLESLKEEFFVMLNTTKKIEEKKELSSELEDIAKTFFK